MLAVWAASGTGLLAGAFRESFRGFQNGAIGVAEAVFGRCNGSTIYAANRTTDVSPAVSPRPARTIELTIDDQSV